MEGNAGDGAGGGAGVREGEGREQTVRLRGPQQDTRGGSCWTRVGRRTVEDTRVTGNKCKCKGVRCLKMTCVGHGAREHRYPEAELKPIAYN